MLKIRQSAIMQILISGLICHSLMREDIIMLVALSRTDSFTFSAESQMPIRNILTVLSALITKRKNLGNC